MNDNPYKWKAEVDDEADEDGDWKVEVRGARLIYDPLTLYTTDKAAAEDLAARINGTNQPTGNVRPDLLDGTNLIRNWLVGRTVDSVGLAAELRAWFDTFQPTEAEVTCPAGTCKGCPDPAACAALSPTDLPDGVSPWLGDEADAVALGHIVQTLPDDEWQWSQFGYGVWSVGPNSNAAYDFVYLLRRKPQTVTLELPKDATDEQILAAAREALGR